MSSKHFVTQEIQEITKIKTGKSAYGRS